MMKKYEKVFREDYETWYAENAAYRMKVAEDPDRLQYHLMPETGWLNDPNGLCQFHGTYHISYQYTPFEPSGELKLWGHYTTEDFIHYTDHGPILFPDQDFDAHGVYSGSALVEQDMIHYFYTGNVKYFDREDYDYIRNGRGSNTVHVMSRDGVRTSDKELLLTVADYPEDISCHVRDPKVFRQGDAYYMVLGARDQKDKGLVLLYRSEDLRSWEYRNRITTGEAFGYMWECPDLFWLDGELCLICCPQGVERRGLDFWNVHQCTVMSLDYDFEKNISREAASERMRMVDRGFDFYAPQTFEDEKGRRILIGWMGIPDADYKNPTTERGWQHALTLPRELHWKNGRLLQQPIGELQALRKEKREFQIGQEPVSESELVYEADLQFDSCIRMELTLRKGVRLTEKDGELTLDLGDCGSGRTVRKAAVKELRRIQVFSDTSSLELFINDGEEVFTTRVYGREPEFRVIGDCKGTVSVWKLGGFIYDRA